MGQLSGRLKEILREYGVDPAVRRPEIDAIASLEATSRADDAHAIFERVRRETAELRLADLDAALARRAWLAERPDASPEGLTLREVDRLIRALAKAEGEARALEGALAEAREGAQGLVARVTDADFTPFARVAFADLPRAAADAEALRRRIAREARIEARYAALRARAAKLDPAKVIVPDASSAAVPDPAEADAQLSLAEDRVARAEAVNDAYARVLRELRDPALRDYKRDAARALRKRADAAALGEDRAAGAAALEGVVAEAARLREEAAATAREAARARRSGRAPPERERRRTDAQDGYG